MVFGLLVVGIAGWVIAGRKGKTEQRQKVLVILATALVAIAIIALLFQNHVIS